MCYLINNTSQEICLWLKFSCILFRGGAGDGHVGGREWVTGVGVGVVVGVGGWGGGRGDFVRDIQG